MKKRPPKINKVLFDHELIKCEDNIIYAERAFMAHSAAQWGMGMISRNEFTQKQIDSFGKIMMMYLKGKIDLSWGQEGTLRLVETGKPPQEHEQNAP
jgi:hypothetical protein